MKTQEETNMELGMGMECHYPFMPSASQREEEGPEWKQKDGLGGKQEKSREEQ